MGTSLVELGDELLCGAYCASKFIALATLALASPSIVGCWLMLECSLELAWHAWLDEWRGWLPGSDGVAMCLLYHIITYLRELVYPMHASPNVSSAFVYSQDSSPSLAARGALQWGQCNLRPMHGSRAPLFVAGSARRRASRAAQGFATQPVLGRQWPRFRGRQWTSSDFAFCKQVAAQTDVKASGEAARAGASVEKSGRCG